MLRFPLELDLVLPGNETLQSFSTDDRQIELLFRSFSRQILPFQIRGENDSSGFRIDRPRRAEAYSSDLLGVEVALIDRILNAARDPLDMTTSAPRWLLVLILRAAQAFLVESRKHRLRS